MPGRNSTKKVCGAKLRSRPWDGNGCQRRAADWGDRCVQHSGPKTDAGKVKSLEALARGRENGIAVRQQKAMLRQKAKGAAKAWIRDFGHPAGPMVIALFDPHHITHTSVWLHAEQLIETARAGYE